MNAADRLCECGNGVQDESHVLLNCPKTGSVHKRFGVHNGIFRDIGDLMNAMDVHELIPFVYNCVKLFD